MFSIAEWTDRASALSYPKKLTSSASFSPSIRISLRLKIHQAQAKNFCRVLDIRVPEIMKTKVGQIVFCQDCFQLSVCSAGGHGCFEFGWIGKDPYRISNVIKLSAFR